MRVLLVTPDFPPAPGGIQLVMSRLAENLAAQTRVVTLGFDGATPLVPAAADVVVAGDLARGGNKVANARLNAAALAAAVRFGPDVVISGHAVAAPGATVAARLRRVPVIHYVHADEARQRPGLVRFAMRRGDAIVAVSAHARELALEAGAVANRIHVINPGVDPAPPDSGARAERPTIVTVARMQESYKGHDTILRALPEIRRRVPDVQWIAIGDGRLRPELERLAVTLGVGDAVRFAGHVDDAERDELLDAAQVFAMPSRLPDSGVGGEGFGIVYLEAGSHRLPVIAGNVGGAVDAVVDGETGLLIDPTDPQALARAACDLLTDPSRSRRLGENGARRASEFSWERHARAIEDLIAKVSR
jgi:phosphatidylinositol alpha-1,6-mannosyltransferase